MIIFDTVAIFKIFFRESIIFFPIYRNFFLKISQPFICNFLRYIHYLSGRYNLNIQISICLFVVLATYVNKKCSYHWPKKYSLYFTWKCKKNVIAQSLMYRNIINIEHEPLPILFVGENLPKLQKCWLKLEKCRFLLNLQTKVLTTKQIVAYNHTRNKEFFLKIKWLFYWKNFVKLTTYEYSQPVTMSLHSVGTGFIALIKSSEPSAPQHPTYKKCEV